MKLSKYNEASVVCMGDHDEVSVFSIVTGCNSVYIKKEWQATGLGMGARAKVKKPVASSPEVYQNSGLLIWRL